MKISNREILYNKIKHDIELSYGDFLYKTPTENNLMAMKIVIEDYIKNIKSSCEVLSFLDVQILTKYDEVKKNLTVNLVPKNEETFTFFMENNPEEYRTYGWDDETNSLIMYM